MLALRFCCFRLICCLLVFSSLSASAAGEDLETKTLQKKLNLPALKQDMKPARLLEIIELDWKIPIEAEAGDEEKRLMKAVLKHINAAADFILADPEVAQETALKAVQHKMQALGILARTGETAAAIQAVELAKQLQRDKRPLLAREGKLIELSSRLREIPKMNQQQVNTFIGELIEIFSSSPLTKREIKIAQVTAQIFEQTGKLDSAQLVLQKTARLLEQSSNKQWKQIADQFKATARRYALPGHPMKLSGRTLKGKTIDIENYKGKVVLVQFWASWCTYCLQEMPHLLKLYHTYHEDGFEVIGVNLDNSAERARKIIEDAQLPWPQIFSTETEAMGMKNPLATYYGISTLPQSILIDRKGNVIRLQARGKILNRELERLFISPKQ